MARLIVVSYRLGGNDGVSVEAAKWIAALRQLGHDVTTLAGEGSADILMEPLAMAATEPPQLSDLSAVLDGADVVIVENLVSLPFNVLARDALYQALDGRSALFRHHDLPWQRQQWRDEPAPHDQATWRHVTINGLSRRELQDRGVEAVTLRNMFDCTPPLGKREETRRSMSLDDERVVLMPTRAIPRKNVPGGVALAESLGAAFWLLGPAEDGYDDELEGALGSTSVRVLRGLANGLSVHDAYAAADLVVLPSTWEGFGNPVLESVTHRRPLAVYPYPVLSEIRDFGFRFFDLDDVDVINRFLDRPREEHFDHNVAIAREHFNVADLPDRLASLLEAIGVN
ncbi:MAG: glycosyltransferase [Acidimicrobiales bacterium]